VLVQVEILNKSNVTAPSSFRAKSAEPPETRVIFVLTMEKPRNLRKVHRKQGQNVEIKERLRIEVARGGSKEL